MPLVDWNEGAVPLPVQGGGREGDGFERAEVSLMSFLKIEDLSKRYAPHLPPVFEKVHFTIERGEFVCIIGHSGCGKSTILNVLAGLESPTSGYAYMDGREISGPSLDRGVVFQSHALMPWLTVRNNVGFAVRSRWPQWSKADVAAHVERFVDMVGLGHAIDKKPSELSGGMKQRVGIARAFAIQPKMLLARRALRRARRAHARHHPGRAAEHRAGGAPDRLHDHARRRRGHPAGRQDPADEQRPARARGRDRAQHDAARPRARHRPPRPAVLPDPQPPGRLPRQPLEADPGGRERSGGRRAGHRRARPRGRRSRSSRPSPHPTLPQAVAA